MNYTNIDWNLIFDMLKSISIIIASGVAIWGINSWRREARWKKKYELAEDVLANLYESQQTIKFLRFPAGFQDEGNSRKIGKNETPEQTKIYNQAYAVRERFEIHSEALKKLQTLKYRFIALFGKEYEEHFNLFSKTVNKIFFAADQIAHVNLGDYGDEKEFNMEIIRESNRTLYSLSSKNHEDEIEKEIQNAVNEIEKVCRNVIGKIKK
ncbi:MAG TPA: hypothetical protein VFM72_07760 [Aequorivita sp.]|nr:hypothetical protein [Aequorivita sp.]